jgi:transmembrane sensor
MSRDLDQDRREAREEAAAGWALRLDSSDADEADWAELQAWLAADPERRAAFARAERVLAELTGAAADLRQALAPSRHAAPVPAQPRRGRRVQMRRMQVWTASSALAAAAAAVVVFVAVRPAAPVPTETYQTAKGENRRLDLADGSHIELAGASRIAVRLDRDARRVTLADGEAAFDVAKDQTRPFLIDAGERTVRVVGTEFDVLRHAGRLRVTVRRGIVAVQPSAAGPGVRPILLHVGDQYERRPGETVAVLRRVDPDAVLAWREGELVYRDQPLADVVDDLNRYYATPVRLDGPAAAARFSGVLKLGPEEAVVERLQAFLQGRVERRPDGIVLSLEPAAH